MSKVKVRFLGSGDAFGSGERLQACILVEAAPNNVLLDCGASSMIACRKYRVDTNIIDLILVTNLHGDHCGGIPYLIVDAQLNRKRTQPLTIAGPTGIKSRLPEIMGATFPGSAEIKTKFALEIIELEAGTPWQYERITVTPFPVIHADADTHLALRISCGEKVLAYSGDTEWTESLVHTAFETDLFIVESYFYDKKIHYHLDYLTILEHWRLLKTKNLVITHMSEAMLARLDDVVFDYAEDGKVFEL